MLNRYSPWRCADGTITAPADMTDTHLDRALAYVQKLPETRLHCLTEDDVEEVEVKLSGHLPEEWVACFAAEVARRAVARSKSRNSYLPDPTFTGQEKP